jgi:alpha-L-rhamnosidase
MHRIVAGIAPLEPGYRKVRIAPRPGGTLTWVESSLETRWGVIRVRWDRDGDEFCTDITIPDGVEAELDLPGLPAEWVTAGRHVIASKLG